MWMSELLPWTAQLADEIAIVKTVWTEAINHDPAVTYICTGHQLPGRPSLGSWLSYGLGTMNQNLPAFVVMTASWSSHTASAGDLQPALGHRLSAHQAPRRRFALARATRFSSFPIPRGVDAATRRRTLDAINRLNHHEFDQIRRPRDPGSDRPVRDGLPHADARSPSSPTSPSEPQRILDMYGPDVHKPGTFARCCLLARRLAERDVRFVQIFHRGWDQHGNLAGDLPLQCKDVDQATFALVTDLKQRGLLDDTLVIWGGEFGRTIYCQGKLSRENYGRDHHPKCFPIWMAGGGIKPGVSYGETDDFSYNVVANPVHIHDMNATILHCLGIDHRRLSFKFQGLDVRLTGVEEHHPVKEILA